RRPARRGGRRPADGHPHVHVRPPGRRRRPRGRLPPHAEGEPRGSGARLVGPAVAPTVWYHVRDLDEGRRFYRDLLGFEELAVDLDPGWSTLQRGEMEIGLAVGEPSDDGVAHVDVRDLKEE